MDLPETAGLQTYRAVSRPPPIARWAGLMSKNGALMKIKIAPCPAHSDGVLPNKYQAKYIPASKCRHVETDPPLVPKFRFGMAGQDHLGNRECSRADQMARKRTGPG